MAKDKRDKDADMTTNRNAPELGIGKGDEGDGRRRPDGPLDGSTSGTIGGGGREIGGSTARPSPRDMPEPDPADAASGRMAPDPLAATANPDPPGAIDSVTSVSSEDEGDARADADE